jgi:hypothetical protein
MFFKSIIIFINLLVNTFYNYLFKQCLNAKGSTWAQSLEHLAFSGAGHLDAMVDTLLSASDVRKGRIRCRVCGFGSARNATVRRHVEQRHVVAVARDALIAKKRKRDASDETRSLSGPF